MIRPTALAAASLALTGPGRLAATMAPIEANGGKASFAWFGPVGPRGAAAWRVVGPTVILKSAPRSNDGGPTDHAHNIYRDPTSQHASAGADLGKEHTA